MSRLFVNHEVLIDSAVKARQVSAEISRGRAVLDGRAQGLLASGWTGPAATGFAAAMRQWDEGAGGVLDALSRMGDLIARADREFGRTDVQRAATLRAAGPVGSSGLNL